MKKALLIVAILPLLIMTGCARDNAVRYSDDEPIVLEMRGDTLKILQLTDLHLTYGVDYNDRRTFALIKTMVESDTWDLVVISGDMTLSPLGPSLFGRLVKLMEQLATPWTFVFGNHETDYQTQAAFLRKTANTQHLMFKTGPELEDGGVGNFAIRFDKDGVPFYKAYFLDSHAERKEYTAEEGEYGYLRESQVEWYVNHVQNDTVDSVMYFHIPLRQFVLAETDPEITYEGLFLEDKVYPQGIDTGMFAAIVANHRTKGVFVGHDHLNDFHFLLDGVLLGYGRASGYAGYGHLERGGRVVIVAEDGVMTSRILLESEARP